VIENHFIKLQYREMKDILQQWKRLQI